MAIGPFSGDKTSSRTDSSVNSASGASQQARDKGRTNSGISLEKNAKLNTGLSLDGGTVTGNVTYTTQNGVGADGIKSLVETFTTSSGSQLSSLVDLFKSQQSQIGTLAENKQTEGDASRNRIVLIVVIAVLVLVGLAIWRRK